MSAKGYCYDNAFAESCFASIMSEVLDKGHPFASKAAARTALFDYLACFYNVSGTRGTSIHRSHQCRRHRCYDIYDSAR